MQFNDDSVLVVNRRGGRGNDAAGKSVYRVWFYVAAENCSFGVSSVGRQRRRRHPTLITGSGRGLYVPRDNPRRDEIWPPPRLRAIRDRLPLRHQTRKLSAHAVSLPRNNFLQRFNLLVTGVHMPGTKDGNTKVKVSKQVSRLL